MKTYKNAHFDEERALYGIYNAEISNCVFDGPADGESALKEAQNISVVNCDFRLRYPFWHVTNAHIENSTMTEGCRAALWYDQLLTIRGCHLGGIKAIRECKNITIDTCTINSSEFGWMSENLTIRDTELITEYPFLHSKDMIFDGFKMKGKYSFQYCSNVEIRNSELDTKDAFWHSRDVVVYDSVIKGEYLGWYSENLRLVRCKIIGTQPLCYAKGLVLEECEMIDCDLAFEKTELKADIKGNVDSIKNPTAGYIHAVSIGQIIMEQQADESSCEILLKAQ